MPISGYARSKSARSSHTATYGHIQQSGQNKEAADQRVIKEAAPEQRVATDVPTDAALPIISQY